MIPTPIQHALATLRQFEVPTLLIGGQACILYGGAEFSRDLDLMLAATPSVLPQLARAIEALGAELIAVPPLSADMLDRGHAVHFRCSRPDVAGLWLDLMTRPPRLTDIEAVWNRRVTFDLPAGPVDVVALPDLIQTKKTQRDKDWATIGELIDADMVVHSNHAHEARVEFWLRECRDAETLIELARSNAGPTVRAARDRPVVEIARNGDALAVERALGEEQITGKAADRAYWAPLRAELERVRHDLRREAQE